MNARLKAKLAKPKLHRAQIGALIESMDWCDPTRTHERLPYWRLRDRHYTKRTLHVLVATGFCGLAILAAAWR